MWKDLVLRLRALLFPRRMDEELQEELQFHTEMQARKNDLFKTDPVEARRQARLQFGSVVVATEECRDARGISSIELLAKDLRYAARVLRKSPGFTAAALLMLALGIGATTATFSVVEGVLLRPLPFRDPDRILSVGDKLRGVDWGNAILVSSPEIPRYTRDMRVFESNGAYTSTTFELSGVGEPARVNAARMGARVFSALGVEPILGRFFTQQEDDDSQRLTLLSYSMWQSRFHGDPQAIGTKLLLDRQPYMVIGVMPRNFEFPLVPGQLNRSELWVPLSLTQAELTQGFGSWNFQMVGRLKPGATAAQAQAGGEQVAGEIMRNFPSFMASVHISAVVRSLQEDTVLDARALVRVLFLAVCVVLLIVCVNIAGLLLVRAIRRRHEVGVRLALGASPAALLRQAVMESLLLSVTGGLLGLVLARIALQVSISQLPETLPRISEIHLDWVVATFALALALTTGVLCSVAPAFAAIRTNLNDSLREGGRSGQAGSGHARLRSLLVVTEIAIALVLVAASGLLLRSFEKMRQVPVGFRPQNVVIAAYTLPKQLYGSQAAVNTFNRELLRRLEAIPGAEFAGITSAVPMSGGLGKNAIVVEGYVPPPGASLNIAGYTFTVGQFFDAMGIRLLRGRFFTAADTADAPLVLIVNHKLAQHYWPNEDPIGKRLRSGTPELETPWLTVVGEVDDVKQDSPDVETVEQYYEPVEQVHASLGRLGAATDISGGYLIVRTTLPPERMENEVRRTVRSLDLQLALTQVQTMEQAVLDSEAPRRFNTAVISGFAGAAMLLAALGIYSVVAFSVELRAQEIAIRMALGSKRSSIVRLILRSGGLLAATGCAAGLLGSIGASRLISSLLFQVNPLDPLLLAGAAVAVLLLALLASAMPAIHASAIDPIRTLRSQ